MSKEFKMVQRNSEKREFGIKAVQKVWKVPSFKILNFKEVNFQLCVKV